MNVVCLFSGGKDSTYALSWALKNHKVLYLVSMFSKREDSYMYHIPNIHLTEILAQALEIPIITGETKGIKEEEVEDLYFVLKEIPNVEGVVTGAWESNYQRERIEEVCKRLELKVFNPLWKKDPEEVLKKMIKKGFEIIIVGVAAHGFNEDWLGRKLDLRCLKDLKELNKKFEIHLAGEGGEYETLVTDGPIFKKKLEILKTEKHWDGSTNSGFLEVKKFKLLDN
jgi:diphthine-ammonia ligase